MAGTHCWLWHSCVIASGCSILARCLTFWCLSLVSGVMVMVLFTCLLTHLVGSLATRFQSLHERLHVNPCHNLLCLLLPLKLLVFPKDLPSVTIHLLHFYAPQLSKHQCLSNPVSHYHLKCSEVGAVTKSQSLLDSLGPQGSPWSLVLTAATNTILFFHCRGCSVLRISSVFPTLP